MNNEKDLAILSSQIVAQMPGGICSRLTRQFARFPSPTFPYLLLWQERRNELRQIPFSRADSTRGTEQGKREIVVVVVGFWAPPPLFLLPQSVACTERARESQRERERERMEKKSPAMLSKGGEVREAAFLMGNLFTGFILF